MDQSFAQCWSNVAGLIIDGIVRALKRTQRWKTDGPSLRVLNHHWCQQLNQHIDQICPHKCRCLGTQDLQSLKKFPSVTSLDATMFLGGCADSFAAAASKLQDLSHLEVGTVVAMLNVSEEALAELQGVTSLRLGRWYTSKVSGGCLQRFGCLPVQELVIDCCFVNIEESLRPFQRLKRLALNQPLQNFSFLSEDPFRSLESLKLSCESHRLSELSVLTSLVELECVISSQADFCLKNLPNLSSLKLLVEPQANGLLASSELSKVLRNLTSLVMFCEAYYPALHLSEKFPRLKHLSLAKACFYASQMKKNLSGLTSLVLLGCIVEEKSAFLSSLSNVQKLCLASPERRPSACSLPLDGEILPEIKILSVPASLVVGAMYSGKTLDKLETLCLSGDFTDFTAQTGFGHDWLENLPMLRELGLQYKKDPDDIQRLLNQALLSKLELLCIDTEWHGRDRREDFTRTLREKAPQLKIEYSIVDFSQFLVNGM